MKGARVALGCFVLYLAVAIFTYGHAASHALPRHDNAERVAIGLGSGFAWPLYWSWTWQDR